MKRIDSRGKGNGSGTDIGTSGFINGICDCNGNGYSNLTSSGYYTLKGLPIGSGKGYGNGHGYSCGEG